MSSKPFKFIIGPCRKTFTVHSALVAHHSAPLKVLMEGPMSEAKEGCAELDDVDEKTFIWFCEYVYSGNYSPAPQSHVFNASAIASIEKDLDPTIEPETPWGVSSKKEQKKSKKRAFPETTRDSWDLEVDHNQWNSLWKEFQNKFQHTPDHKNELRWDHERVQRLHRSLPLPCSHICLFTQVQHNKALFAALSNLHETLLAFELHGERISDIVNLAKYCYNNNHTRDCEPGQDIDDLRKLVAHYVACKFEIMGKHEDFLALMEGGGPLARDLTGFLLRRWK